MKRILLVTLFAFATHSLFAQKIKVEESNEQIGGSKHPALTVSVFQASAEKIEKELKSMMKDYDAKVSTKDGGLFGDNALIKKISLNTVDIYAKWEKVNDDETKVTIAFDLGGVFLSSSQSAEFKEAKDIVKDFATKTTSNAFEALFKTEAKTFDALNDEEKDLEKDNKNLNEDIVSYKQKIDNYNEKIKKAQEDIETNNKKMAAKKEEIGRQQKELTSTKDKKNKVE